MANRSVGRDPPRHHLSTNHQVTTSWAPWVPACFPRRRPGNPWALPAAGHRFLGGREANPWENPWGNAGKMMGKHKKLGLPSGNLT